MNYMDLVATGEKSRIMPHEDGIVRGGFLLWKRLYCTHSETFTTCDKEGNVQAAVLNTLGEDMVAKKDLQYGAFTLVCDRESWDHTPWRTCIVRCFWLTGVVSMFREEMLNILFLHLISSCWP